MTEELREICAAQGLRKRVKLYHLDRISTPLTYGFLKPKILLPCAILLTKQELAYVIVHEYAHIHRGDAARRLLMTIAVCCHWFNPLVWLMAAVYRRDMELSCDHQVVHKFGEAARPSYAKALIALEEKKAFSGILCDWFSYGLMEERVGSVMAGKKPTAVGGLWAAIVFLITLAVFATSPEKQNILAMSSVSL